MLRFALPLVWLLPAVLASTSSPTTNAPSSKPTPFVVPPLPISKASAKYPDCRAELIFAIDVSGSVADNNQDSMFTFTDYLIVEVEKNIKDGRYGVVVFGIEGRNLGPNEFFTGNGMNNFGIPGPYGNGVNPASTTVFVGLEHLGYNCTECFNVTSRITNYTGNFSQLEMLYNVKFNGWLTPTWDAIDMVRKEFTTNGDPTVPGRFVILLTDGVPNAGSCNPTDDLTSPGCVPVVNRTNTSVVGLKKDGALVITIGFQLLNQTAALLVEWASEPRDILAITGDYDKLNDLVPKLLAIMCPLSKGSPCLEAGADHVDIEGSGFLNTGLQRCRFTREGKTFLPQHETGGKYVSSTVLRCPLPTTDDFFPGTWSVNYTQDGRGYNFGNSFKYGTVCNPQLLVIWWPFCALALLPLAFCRPARKAPATTTKVTRGVARPAPAATEEYEEYEEVEEIVAPPPPVNKWKVAPTAYIGFGRARLSVDWAGVAPESAPHEGVRKKVVKKVVTDHAPVPTAGPANTPVPASMPAEETTTTTTSRPPIVEEPDWMNSFMDRVAAVVCCCCVNKK
jgi:hypothetical protein